MTIADVFNEYLRSHFDIDDSEYTILIADKDGIPAGTINNPTDYNIGAIANIFEYLRNQGKEYVTQLFLDQAEGKFLKLIAQDNIGVSRFKDETNDHYVARLQMIVAGPKISPATIIYYTTEYSSPNPPVILQGDQDGAFSGISFSGNYRSFRNLTPGDEYNTWILPAISRGSNVNAFFFILILENTPDEKIKEVLDTVDRLKAQGIGWQLQINT